MPVVALGAVLAHELNVDVQQRYLETARSSASLITQVGIQPLLNSQQLAGGLSPAEIAQIDDKLQGAAVSDEVRRIKVWNRAGTVVYSDNHALIGKTFPIDEDLGEALEGHSSASITYGQNTENAGDDLSGRGPLIEVYVPLVFKGTLSPSGAFELYLPYAPYRPPSIVSQTSCTASWPPAWRSSIYPCFQSSCLRTAGGGACCMKRRRQRLPISPCSSD